MIKLAQNAYLHAPQRLIHHATGKDWHISAPPTLSAQKMTSCNEQQHSQLQCANRWSGHPLLARSILSIMPTRLHYQYGLPLCLCLGFIVSFLAYRRTSPTTLSYATSLNPSESKAQARVPGILLLDCMGCLIPAMYLGRPPPAPGG